MSEEGKKSRRKDDHSISMKMLFEIGRAAAVVIPIGVILYFLGSVVFVAKSNHTPVHAEINKKGYGMESDIKQLKTHFTYIKDGIEEIKREVRK